MKLFRERDRLYHAKIERSHYALLLLVAIIAFILGMILGSESETENHNSRIEWPQPNTRSFSR